MVFAHNFTTCDGINYGFVPEPHGRGTFKILWTCLMTLFLCTWTVHHLNIPNPKDSTLKKLLRKVGWMIFTVIAPGYTTVNALYQYVQARRSVAAVKAQFGYEWWTMMHTYYALMADWLCRAPTAPDMDSHGLICAGCGKIMSLTFLAWKEKISR